MGAGGRSSLGGSGSGSLGVSLGSSSRRGRRAGAGAVVAGATNNLDALPGTGVVTVDVLLDGFGGLRVLASVINNGDALVVSEERSLAEVGTATSPFSSARRRVGATTNPGSELHLHGGLGESVNTVSISSLKSSNSVTINGPGNSSRSPLNSVGVEGGERAGDRVVSTTVVSLSLTLGVVVGLNLSVVATNPLPIDLIEIIGLKHSGGNDTLSSSSLDLDVDTAEEDVLAGVDGRRVLVALDGEDSTVTVVGQGSTISNAEVIAGALGEVTVDLAVAEGRVSLACGGERVAVGMSLGGNHRSSSESHRGGESFGEHFDGSV